MANTRAACINRDEHEHGKAQRLHPEKNSFKINYGSEESDTVQMSDKVKCPECGIEVLIDVAMPYEGNGEGIEVEN